LRNGPDQICSHTDAEPNPDGTGILCEVIDGSRCNIGRSLVYVGLEDNTEKQQPQVTGD